MEFLALFYAILIMFIIYSSRSERSTTSRDKRISATENNYEAQVAAIQAHIDGANRLRGDFVLTGAALPFGDNAITPIEGFRLIDRHETDGFYFVVAAVSAEKIFHLIRAFIELLGDFAQIAILRLNNEENRAVDYIADEMDAFMLLSILEAHKELILNDGGVEINFFNAQGHSELRLDACKHFQFFTHDLVSIVDLLHDFNVHSIKDLRFFPEGSYLTVCPANGDQMLTSFLSEFTIVQTNYLDNKQTS